MGLGDTEQPTLYERGGKNPSAFGRRNRHAKLSLSTTHFPPPLISTVQRVLQFFFTLSSVIPQHLHLLNFSQLQSIFSCALRWKKEKHNHDKTKLLTRDLLPCDKATTFNLSERLVTFPELLKWLDFLQQPSILQI